MNIELNISQYLHKFKKYPKATTLFELQPKDITRALLQKKCPHCGCKLYQTRDKKLWRCKSVKRDGYIIRDEVIKKYW